MSERIGVDAVRATLLELAGLQGWEGVRIKPGETAGGTERMWRTFAVTANEATLRHALDVAWDLWVETELSPAWQKAAWRWFREPVSIR